jgi:hypothetical protein
VAGCGVYPAAPVSSPDRLRERHHELIDILNALRRRIHDVIAVGTPAQRKELIEAIVAEIRIDGGTVYPIFGLPQDDENLADTISTRDKSHRFAQWCGWWGGWGSNPRPADYEKYGPVHRTHYLHRYHRVVPTVALIAPFARVTRSTPDHGDHRMAVTERYRRQRLDMPGLRQAGDVVDLDNPPFFIDRVEDAVPPGPQTP